MAREGFFENMKDAPELWVLTGIMLLLFLRWFFLATVEHKQKNYTGDDDFEHASPRGRIQLKEEDIQGLSLVQLESLDATGKYLLPPKVKAGVEEFRSIAKSIDYDIKSENSKKKKRPSDLGIEDKFGDDEDEDYESKLDNIRQERKESILEQVIQKNEWEEAEREKREKQVKQAKPQSYRNASSQVMYEKSAHPNLYSKFNYADKYQKKDQNDKQSKEVADQASLKNKAQQHLEMEIQTKAQITPNELDSISKQDPKQLQMFGNKKKSTKTENSKVEKSGINENSNNIESNEIKEFTGKLQE